MVIEGETSMVGSQDYELWSMVRVDVGDGERGEQSEA